MNGGRTDVRRHTPIASMPLALAGVVSLAAAAPGLVDAVKQGDRDAVRAALKQRADVNAPEVDGTTPLHWAVRADDREMVEMLIRAGARAKVANRYRITPLSLAAVNGNAGVMEALLVAEADPNDTRPEGETVLMTAARAGSASGGRLLLARGADVNAKESWYGQTALMWAAARITRRSSGP